jgi:glycosyltransferase involved in cell wall biosynthesis
MKILILTELYPETDQAEITGGVEARCWYVARHLDGRHRIRVLARSTDATQWRPPSLVSVPVRVLGLLRMLWQGLRSDFDVVEGTNLVTCPLAWLLGKLKRRPSVYWYPDVLIGAWRGGAFGAAGVFGEAIERVVLWLKADRYIAISHSTARKLVKAGVDEDRIRVVPCGFEPASVDEARVGTTPSLVPQLAMVSRLVSYKRVDLVVRALASLRQSHPDLRLVVIGQGPERDAVLALARELGVGDRVELRGFVPSHVDVLREVGRSSVFVAASEIEGFGIVVVEALALGVPFVISAIDAFREVTHEGTGGLLFAPGDVDDLAAKLARLLDDAALRAQSIADGLALAATYTWERVADETEKVYGELA